MVLWARNPTDLAVSRTGNRFGKSGRIRKSPLLLLCLAWDIDPPAEQENRDISQTLKASQVTKPAKQ
jgi:hypothetical protein